MKDAHLERTASLLAFIIVFGAVCAVIDPQWVGEWSAKVYKAFLMEMME